MERAIRALVAWHSLAAVMVAVMVAAKICQDLRSAKVAIGALENDSQLRLTPLGFHLAHMPVDVRIGTLPASMLFGQRLKPSEATQLQQS